MATVPTDERREQTYADYGEPRFSYRAVAPDGYVTTTGHAAVAESLARGGWSVTADPVVVR